ncbi:S41 family peptidase [Chitinimonas naiadis]
MKSASPRFPRLALALLLASLACPGHAGELDEALNRANSAMGDARSILTRLRTQAWNASQTDGAPLSANDLKALADAESALNGPMFRNVHSSLDGLVSESFNFRYNLFEVYSTQGEDNKALDVLKGINRNILLPSVSDYLQKIAKAEAQPGNPDLKRTLSAMRIPARMGGASPIGAPYSETLTAAEKVAGLSLFWSNARSSFVYFDHVPELNWDAAYLAYLPKVMATTTTKEYYQVLMQFAALLKDGHSGVFPPQQLEGDFYGRPPIRTAMVEGKVLITSIQSPTVRQHMQVGEEVVAINDLPVARYAKEMVAPYVTSSSPQDHRFRLYGSQLLSGDVKQPLKLTLKTAAGKKHTETLARDDYGDTEPRQKFGFTMLPGNIAHLVLDHFETDQAVSAFKSHLPEIMQAKGLILDVRRNGGGSTDFGVRILSYLSQHAIPYSISWARSDNGLEHARNDLMMWRPLPDNPPMPPAQLDVYDGPVMVLAGPQTYSAAEDFLVAFDLMQRGKIIGEASGGSTGQPLLFKLPGGGLARVCTKRDTYPDGREIVGVGVQPQITVAPTIADIRAGRDPVLERAITEIKATAR